MHRRDGRGRGAMEGGTAIGHRPLPDVARMEAARRNPGKPRRRGTHAWSPDSAASSGLRLLFPSSSRRGGPKRRDPCLPLLVEEAWPEARDRSLPLLVEEGWPEGPGWSYRPRLRQCMTATPRRPGGFAATPPRERRGISLGTHRCKLSLPLVVEKGWPEGAATLLFPSSSRRGGPKRGDPSLPLLVEEGWPEGPGWLACVSEASDSGALHPGDLCYALTGRPRKTTALTERAGKRQRTTGPSGSDGRRASDTFGLLDVAAARGSSGAISNTSPLFTAMPSTTKSASMPSLYDRFATCKTMSLPRLEAATSSALGALRTLTPCVPRWRLYKRITAPAGNK